MQRSAAPVLVTGAMGLIGRAVCDRLSRAGTPVVATFLDTAPDTGDDAIGWVHADLGEPGLIEGLGELGGVVHLAARLPVSLPESEPQARANRAIDENVIGPALSRGVPLAYASTASVYAGDPPAGGWGELGPATGTGPYLDQKRWAEAHGTACAQDSDATFTALRINAPYGPAQRARTVVQIFLDQAIAGGPITFHGDGDREQDFVFADDVAAACLAALEGPGGIFNVAGGEPVSMRRLAETVAACAGLEPGAVVSSGEADPQEDRRVRFDITRAARVLGWEPRVALAEGLKRCLAARVAR